MGLTIGFYFVAAIAVTVVGMLMLVIWLDKEYSQFVKELQSSLESRIIAHNKAKAQLAILKTRYSKLSDGIEAIRVEARKEEPNFAGLLAEAEFVEGQEKPSTETEARGFDSLNAEDIF